MLRAVVIAGLLAGCGGADDVAADVSDDAHEVSDDTHGPDVDAAPLQTLTTDPGARVLSRLATLEELPGLADQPSIRGRRIGTLAAFDARIYFGYGDYSDNTGPIQVLSYEPASAAFDASHTVTTEEVLRFTRHTGRLFSPDIDPKGHQAEGSGFRLESADSAWETMTPIAGAVHTFALASHDGRLFAANGSLTGGAATLTSTEDLGETWVVEHSTQAPGSAFARYTQVGSAGGVLFLGGWLSTAPRQQLGFVMDGGDWRPVHALPPKGSLVPMEIDGALIVANINGDHGKGGTHLGTYRVQDDALQSADYVFPAGQRVINWSTDQSGGLWVLTRTGAGDVAILLREDAAWTEIAVLTALPDDEFSAVARLGNHVYLGTLGGDFYTVAELYAPAP